MALVARLQGGVYLTSQQIKELGQGYTVYTHMNGKRLSLKKYEPMKSSPKALRLKKLLEKVASLRAELNGGMNGHGTKRVQAPYKSGSHWTQRLTPEEKSAMSRKLCAARKKKLGY